MSSVNVARLLAQFFAIPILARLLSPSDYGVVAISMPFLLFAMMIADAGIGMSLVRTPTSERVVWSTCFWLSVILGASLAVAMGILAPIVSYVFGEPQLRPIIMTLGLIVFSQAICSIPGALLQQSQRYQLIAFMEMSAIGVGIAVAVIVALNGGGAWALVAQQLAFYIIRTCLNFWFSKFKPLMVFDLREVKDHLSFGLDVLGVNVLGFFTRSIDNLVIGKILSAASVGIYSMAFQFARIPQMLVTGPLQYVLYGQLALAKSDIKSIRSVFIVITSVIAIVIFPTMAMVAVAYKPIFSLILSEKWTPSGNLFMIVAAACTVQAVTALCGTILLVLGRSDIRLRMTVEFGVIWILSLFATVNFGLNAIAVAYNAAVLMYTPRMLALVLPLIECRASAYWRAMVIPTVISAFSIVVYLIAQNSREFSNSYKLLIASTIIVCAILIGGMVQRGVIIRELALWRREHVQREEIE